MNTTTTAADFCEHLQLDGQGVQRLVNAIEARPLPWGVIGEHGWKSPEGKAFQSQFTYYQSPKDYIDWRSFIGGTLLLDAAAKFGLCTAAAQIQPFIGGKQPAPVRFVRRVLFEQLLEAGRYPVSSSLQAPLPRLLLVLPKGTGDIVVNPADNDEPAVLGVIASDGEHGITLQWCAWGRSGCSWTCPPQTEPDDHPLSVLAWGAIGLLASEPEIKELELPAPTGRRLSRSARPAPSWLEPPVVHRYLSRSELLALEHGSVRPHWRRGFVRQQAFGPKNSKRKEIWIPPVWVQGTGEENVTT